MGLPENGEVSCCCCCNFPPFVLAPLEKKKKKRPAERPFPKTLSLIFMCVCVCPYPKVIIFPSFKGAYRRKNKQSVCWARQIPKGTQQQPNYAPIAKIYTYFLNFKSITGFIG